jgi:hypothetical protein
MDRFVCVRLVQANQLDLSLFQFDWELTFAVFLMNADKTIYGRYGSRSDWFEAERDISLEGLQKAMRAALELHRSHPASRQVLAAKTGPKPKYKMLAEYPWIQQRGVTRQHCMHCHHVGSAVHMVYRAAGKPIPDKTLFAWPMPDVIGLRLDPKEIATVKEVIDGSLAQRAGLQKGDQIQSLEGQPILSTADVQWVLHNSDEAAKLTAQVLRNGKTKTVALSLEKGWRRNTDIAWRPTSFWLRRVAFGGMRLEKLSAADHRRTGVSEDALALRVRNLGNNAPARRSGVRPGDIVVSFDGRSGHSSESDLLVYGVQKKLAGAKIPITVLRAGKRINLTLTVE